MYVHVLTCSALQALLNCFIPLFSYEGWMSKAYKACLFTDQLG